MVERKGSVVAPYGVISRGHKMWWTATNRGPSALLGVLYKGSFQADLPQSVQQPTLQVKKYLGYRRLRLGGREDIRDSFLGHAGLGQGELELSLQVAGARLGAVERSRLQRHLDGLGTDALHKCQFFHFNSLFMISLGFDCSAEKITF